MIRSMTGFAEKSFASKTLAVKITLRSLNHRYFDWSFRGNQIKVLENSFRSICQGNVHRGRLEVFIDLTLQDSDKWELRINEGLLENILTSVENVSTRTGRALTFPVDNLFEIPHLVEIKPKAFTREEKAFLEESFRKTLEELLKTRSREGRELKKDIQAHIKNAVRIVARLAGLAGKQPALIRKKLTARLKELGHEASLSEEKLLEETAYMAQRYDLTEEINRLKSHLGYVGQLLRPDTQEPVGRKLDFVAQELYREANTINSKSQDINVTRESLALKAEIESFRQQIQNIE